MTTADVFTTMWRRWPAILVGLALTAGSLMTVYQHTGVYWVQEKLVFVAPKSARYPNSILQSTGSLVTLAGIIERDVNHGARITAPAYSSATLAGEGVRDGSIVRLPNDGGQWIYNFDKPVLVVESVAATPEIANARVDRLSEDVKAALAKRQADDDVATKNLVGIAATDRLVSYLPGHKMLALAMTMGVGLCGTVLLSVYFDRLMRVRPRRAVRASERDS